MIAAFIVLTALLASYMLVRSQQKEVDRGWKQLAAAVPEQKALAASTYREQVEPDAMAPVARTALELLPRSKAVKRAQKIVALAAPPLAALLFALFPFEALGPWSALVGALWGTAMSGGLLQDNRKLMGAVALVLLPMAAVLSLSFTWHFFPFWGVAGLTAIYGAARRVLDLKDQAGQEEADRERDADPRYLIGSTIGRAAAIARSRGGSGESVERDDSVKGTTVT